MATSYQRNVWVDHWTIHQDGSEPQEEANSTNSAIERTENISAPRNEGLASFRGASGAMHDGALSFAPGEGTQGVQDEQEHHMGTTTAGHEVRSLGYPDAPNHGHYAMNHPIPRRVSRNQLQESRWATRDKKQEIWREPPKQFVKAKDQSPLNEDPSNVPTHSEEHGQLPPHLRRVPAQSQQKTPEPEPQQQLDVALARNSRHGTHGTGASGRLLMKPAPVKIPGSTHGDTADSPVALKTPVSTEQEGEASSFKLKLEASLAIFGVDPPRADPDRDPRSEVPVQTWTEQDWNETRRPKKKNKSFESESISHNSGVSGNTSAHDWAPTTAMNVWIGRWILKVPNTAEAPVFQNRPMVHDDCDVDCETGTLLPPVQYPRDIKSKSTLWDFHGPCSNTAQIQKTRPS